MRIIGLTGSIGMGKSATAGLFAARGLPVHDADAAVHALYAPGGTAVIPVETAFPGTSVDGGIDRTRLSAAVLGRPDAMKTLEAIVHPLVAAARDTFLRQAREAGGPAAILDVPLLFETGGDRHVDSVVVVSAPLRVQRARVLERPGMTAERFSAILARQTPDSEKRRRADHVIDTDRGLTDAAAQVDRMLAALAGRAGLV